MRKLAGGVPGLHHRSLFDCAELASSGVQAADACASKLQAAFAVVIIVALGTAAVGAFGLVQRAQRQQAVNRLTDIAIIAAGQMRMLTWREASSSDIADFMSILSQLYDVRILLLDDTNRTLVDVSPEGGRELAGHAIGCFGPTGGGVRSTSSA